MSEEQSYEQILMRNISILGEDLGKLYTYVSNELSEIFIIWNELQSLFGKSQKRIDLLNHTAPSFFSHLQKLMLNQLLINIARLTDPPKSKGKKNISIYAINKGNGDKEIIEEFIKLRKEVKSIRKYRHKKIAHLDLNARLRGKVFFLNNNVTKEIERVIQILQKILNIFERKYLNTQVLYKDVIPAVGDSNSLLHYLAAGRYFLDEWNKKNLRGEVDPKERSAWSI